MDGAFEVDGSPSRLGTLARWGALLRARLRPARRAAAPPTRRAGDERGGPLLLVTGTGPFGAYLAEILRAEGLKFFTTVDVSALTPWLLGTHDVAIVAETALTDEQAATLTAWVEEGGRLVAMRPAGPLAALCGLGPPEGALAEGYLAIDTTRPPGEGLVADTIQYHGTADLRPADGARVVATLYADATTATAFPAVTVAGVGTRGGQAAAFLFDLARSVVYTRQGNPAWEGQARSGTQPLRARDLFFGAAAFDPQPDWVNLDKVAIPQADEQQRLLANLILDLADRPWPRLWYLPSFHKAAIVMTGDQHSCCATTVDRFQIYLDQSPDGASVADWEAVRASSYVRADEGLSDEEARRWTELGFELGVHVNTRCADSTDGQLQAFYGIHLDRFAARFPSLPVPASERTHCIAWTTWAGQPNVKARFGIRIDTNYYYAPASWIGNRPGMFTGSGIPMRFADRDGTIIDVFQVTTQMNDEAGQTYPFTCDALLDGALGPEGYYGVFCANMHTDRSPHPGSDAIVASAQARGVPVVSGRQLATWLDARDASWFTSVTWTGEELVFEVATEARNLVALVPAASRVGPATAVARDGDPVEFAMETVKGRDYAVFAVEPGTYRVTFVSTEDGMVTLQPRRWRGVQRTLNRFELRADDGSVLPKLAVDGVPGATTDDALRRFEHQVISVERVGVIPPDGIDPYTLSMLMGPRLAEGGIGPLPDHTHVPGGVAPP